ncbi:hypothetical protein DRQ53_06275 [bacterium]|nr:MAG: hypothetical protein DRQ32_00655 [bacterium]RKZ16476.1 MAG: hypothetical protein DRQ53_06275 [bacterium]
MRMHIATTFSLLLLFGVGGCLVSLTESFDYDVLLETGNEFLDLDGTDGETVPIDLSDDDTFDENRDDIKNVDRVGFEADLYTKDDLDTVVDIFFRKKGSDPWVLLLDAAPVSGVSTAARQDLISYKQSETLIRNFELFQQVAEGGVMELKLKARDGNDQVRVTRLILRITITVGT